MKCSGCNNEIPDDAKICPTCGRSFDKVREFNSAVNSIIESADSNEAAISALILSVLSMFKVTIIFAPIAIVMAVIVYSRRTQHMFAITAIIISVVALLKMIAAPLLFFLRF